MKTKYSEANKFIMTTQDTCPLDLCDGSGLLTTYDSVEAGLPQVPMGEEPCLCTVDDDGEPSEDERD